MIQNSDAKWTYHCALVETKDLGLMGSLYLPLSLSFSLIDTSKTYLLSRTLLLLFLV
jgi:hypothetical protein